MMWNNFGWVVVSAALLLGNAADAAAQGIPPKLHGAAQPPEEIRAMRRAGRDPVRQVTREHLLKVLEEQQPGSTRPENLRGGNPLRGASELPREIKLEAQHRAARAAREPAPPTREHLLEVIRQSPGGPEILEEGRRRGAPIGTTSREQLWRRLARLNSFRPREAWAQSKFLVVLTPESPRSNSPYAYFRCDACAVPNENFYLLSERTSVDGVVQSIQAPRVLFSIQVPADGWYIINFRAWAGADAGLKMIRLPASGLITWVIPGTEVKANAGLIGIWTGATYRWQDYPKIVELSKGIHTFGFHVTPGYAYISSATAASLH